MGWMLLLGSLGMLWGCASTSVAPKHAPTKTAPRAPAQAPAVVPSTPPDGPRKLQAEADSPLLYTHSLATLSPINPVARAGTQPKTLAVLLPVHAEGYRGQAAQTILQGMKSALASPLYRAAVKEVRVYDTAADPASAYAQAVKDKCTLALGPMDATETNSIQDSGDLDIPVVSLGFDPFTPGREHSNLYTFAGLSTENEAAASAEFLFQRGKRSVLIYASDSPLARREVSAFSKHFEALGGRIAQVRFKTAESDPFAETAELLHVDIAMVKSYKALQASIRTLTRTAKPDSKKDQDALQELKDKLLELHHRPDIDAIYLPMDFDDARRVRPLIVYYLANDLLTLIPSHTLPDNNPHALWDFEGVYVSALQQLDAIPSLEPGLTEDRKRLMRLGSDLLKAAWYLDLLRTDPEHNFSFQGDLGSYLLRQDGRIMRLPSFLMIHQGQMSAPVVFSQ